jgi:hypothetical protein
MTITTKHPEMSTPVLTARPDRRNIHHRAALTRRLRGEFQEIPGLCLTPGEASRLFGIAPAVCQRVLAALVEDGLLHRRADGRYVHYPSSH